MNNNPFNGYPMNPGTQNMRGNMYPAMQQPMSYQNGSYMPNQQAYAYNPQPVQVPQYSQAQQSQPQSDIHWVQGQSGAKAYSLAPGQSALLMDSEANKFYIKSTDQSGMPQPLRVFRYTEEASNLEEGQSGSPDMSRFVTKEDFKQMLEEYLGPVDKGSKK